MKSGHDATDQLGLHVEVSKSSHYFLLLSIKVDHLREPVSRLDFFTVARLQVFNEPLMEDF